MNSLEEFSKGLEGKDLPLLIRHAKAESESRILSQGIAHLALFMAEVMMETVAAPGDQVPTPMSVFQRKSAAVSHS